MIYSKEVAERFDSDLLPMLGAIVERQHRKRLIEKYGIDLYDKNIYFVGCGTGREIDETLRDYNPRIVDASDKSGHMVEVARNKFTDVDIKVKNACNLKGIQPGKYDLVNSSLVLDHVRYYKNAISEMFRIAKKNSHIITSIHYPHKVGQEDSLGFFKKPNDLHEVMVWYRPRQAYRKAFNDHGIIVEETSLVTNPEEIGLDKDDFRAMFYDQTNYEDSDTERKDQITSVFDKFCIDDRTDAWGWMVLAKKI